MKPPYIDTSALAKWYLNEPKSREFESFITRQESAAISRLTIVEFRCLLNRRHRNREITPAMATRVFNAFEQDVRDGFLSVRPFEDRHMSMAVELLNRLKDHALRSLDALHLAIASEGGFKTVATADYIFASAAEALGLQAVRFD